MSNNFEKSIAKMSPTELTDIIEFSKSEAQRIQSKLYAVKFPEKITVYYLETKSVEVDDTNEIHVPTAHNIDLKVAVIETLGEAEALVATFTSNTDARLRPVVGHKFEFEGAPVWRQIAEKLLSNTLPKSFFEPEKVIEKVQVLESDDV